MVKDTYSKMLILRFPKGRADSPVVCNLAREYDLTFNILNATIYPRKEGVMVLQLFGTPQNFERGMAYLKQEGIKVQKTEEEIGRNEDVCTHCGTCTAVCPTGALSVSRPDMHVVFDQEKCSVCKLCVRVCPPRAMNLHPVDDLLPEV
ncbi:NIL domain-containing protein [Desulfatibacillum aliphaticivorans]|uniref:NIL domain-containing protein n=1 Tax=Desulfatibacillum aliphaticivorans TaxID=218208 RepID=UPI00041FF867|nr:NIL domain-containing protein [Desulfatibacillum aliphaticivorans]